MIAIKGYALNRLTYNTDGRINGYHVVGDNSSGNWLAQVFTTGHDNEGYDLHSIALAFEKDSGRGIPTDGDRLIVSLYTAEVVGSERHPDRKLFDFCESPRVQRRHRQRVRRAERIDAQSGHAIRVRLSPEDRRVGIYPANQRQRPEGPERMVDQKRGVQIH